MFKTPTPLVLHVCKKYPPAVGGDAVVVANLVHQQRQAGQSVKVLTSNCSQIKVTNDVYKFGLPDQPAALDTLGWRRLVSLLLLTVMAFRLIKKLHPSVIHTHSVDLALAVSLAARWFKVPIVHTFHILTFPDQRQAGWRRHSELWLARAAGLKVITAPNHQDVTALRQRGFNQAQTLPNGIDRADWSVMGSKNLAGPFTFLAVGRLEPQKGYEYVVRAASQLVNWGNADFRIIIVGDGSLRTALQQLIDQLGVAQQVHLVGQQDVATTKQIYMAASCMLITSLWETTPLTLLEAWAMDLPVIATPVGILQDVNLATRTVITVPPGNMIKLAEAMATALSDVDQLQPLVREAKAELAQYSWPVINDQCQQIYDQATV